MIDVPELPPRALSPNGAHGHWGPVAEGRAWLRGVVLEAAQRQAPAPHWPRARVSVTAYVCRRGGRPPYHASDRYRPEDVPNLIAALKPLYDGLQDAGVFAGDKAGQMRIGDHEILEVDDYALEHLVIFVEELPPLNG